MQVDTKNLNNMEITILQGTEKRLYELVAPLVMDPAVLRQNNNVAFKTSNRFVWVVAVDEEKCLGFLPIQLKKEIAEINNYHVQGRDRRLFTAMMKKAEAQAKDSGYAQLLIIAQNSEAPALKQKGYTVEKAFINYTWFVKNV
jgi:hypothetical protein